MKKVLLASTIASLVFVALPLKTQAEMTHAEIRMVVDKIVDMPASEEEGISYTEINQIRSAFKAYGESRRILLKKVKDAMQALNISVDLTGETSTSSHAPVLKAAAPVDEMSDMEKVKLARHTSSVAQARIRPSAVSPALELRRARNAADDTSSSSTRKVLFTQQGGLISEKREPSNTYHFPKKMLKSKKRYSASPLFRLRMM